MKFTDRTHAGEELAEIIDVSDPSNTIVLALPRGGVPLGKIVAERYGVPLNVILAKKIGHPNHSEFAVGAVAEGGEPIFNQETSIEPGQIDQVREEIKRRRKLYNQVLDEVSLKGKDLIIVDDGIATGMTVFAAIESVKKENPNSITVSVPIIPRETYERLKEVVDTVSAVEVPGQFKGAVGAYYQSFPQLEDQEVQGMLAKS